MLCHNVLSLNFTSFLNDTLSLVCQLALKLSAMQQELDACRAGKLVSPYVQVLNAHTDLDALPRHILQQLGSKLRTDAQAVDKVRAFRVSALAT